MLFIYFILISNFFLSQPNGCSASISKQRYLGKWNKLIAVLTLTDVFILEKIKPDPITTVSPTSTLAITPRGHSLHKCTHSDSLRCDNENRICPKFIMADNVLRTSVSRNFYIMYVTRLSYNKSSLAFKEEDTIFHHFKPPFCQFFDRTLIQVLVLKSEELLHWSFHFL